MHSMHAISARPDHQQLELLHQHQVIQHQQHQIHQQQQQQQQQQSGGAQQIAESPGAAPPTPQAAATMTILEPLEHSRVQQALAEEQQVVHVLMEQQPHLVQQQHLVQQHSPQLHQLQPPARTHNELTGSPLRADECQQQQHQHQHQLQHQQLAESQQAPSSSRALEQQDLRQGAQIDGIVADGGGPIVQWLLENYEIADGESLPRSTVYNHYLAHCRQLQMASVNAASFGKLIRSVFVGLKTRRLGTRGHSKYHYFGVRAKPHIRQELLQHQETSGSRDENSNHNTEHTGSDTDSLMDCARLTSGPANASSAPAKRTKRDHSLEGAAYARRAGHQFYQSAHQEQEPFAESGHAPATQDLSQFQQQQQPPEQLGANQEHQLNGANYPYSNGLATTNGRGLGHQHSQPLAYAHQQLPQAIGARELLDYKNYLGANWTTLVDEHWPPASTSQSKSLELLELNYKSYYKRMVELLSELKFAEVEQLCQDFWRPRDERAPTAAAEHQAANGCADAHSYHQHLTFHLMYQLTSEPVVVGRLNEIDYAIYAALESFLLPDMLSPIPRALAQHIRTFAKNIGAWVEQSIKDYDVAFVAEKSRTARAFGYSLRRCASLNHLSTASRAVWNRRSALAQMSMDLLRVDPRDIEHQVSLMGNAETHADLGITTRGGSDCSNGGNGFPPRTDAAEANSHEHNYTGLHHAHHQPQQVFAMKPAQLIQNFLALLEDSYPANSWPDWCRNLVESRVSGSSLDQARNFIFKWNFYISLIMKELTLKSAPSLGSFQLVRLLFDEYIYYLVVSRLAQAQNKTPAQLMRPNSN